MRHDKNMTTLGPIEHARCRAENSQLTWEIANLGKTKSPLKGILKTVKNISKHI